MANAIAITHALDSTVSEVRATKYLYKHALANTSNDARKLSCPIPILIKLKLIKTLHNHIKASFMTSSIHNLCLYAIKWFYLLAQIQRELYFLSWCTVIRVPTFSVFVDDFIVARWWRQMIASGLDCFVTHEFVLFGLFGYGVATSRVKFTENRLGDVVSLRQFWSTICKLKLNTENINYQYKHP